MNRFHPTIPEAPSDGSELYGPPVMEGHSKLCLVELGLSGSGDSSSIPLYVEPLVSYTEFKFDYDERI